MCSHCELWIAIEIFNSPHRILVREYGPNESRYPDFIDYPCVINYKKSGHYCIIVLVFSCRHLDIDWQIQLFNGILKWHKMYQISIWILGKRRLIARPIYQIRWPVLLTISLLKDRWLMRIARNCTSGSECWRGRQTMIVKELFTFS